MLDKTEHEALTERLRKLTAAERQAQENVMRAEIVVESAEKALSAAKAALETDFGVSTVAQAKEVLDRLEEDLLREVASLEAALHE